MIIRKADCRKKDIAVGQLIDSAMVLALFDSKANNVYCELQH